jgi:hypothetical protein
VTHDRSGQESSDFLGEGGTVLSVPDSEVMVKLLCIGDENSESATDRLEFELAQCLLEDEENFEFRFHPVDDRGTYLGLVFRREALENLSLERGLPEHKEDGCFDFQLRSLALGRGYLTFCKKEEGELICLVDLSDAAASICLVHQQNVVDLAHLPLAGRDLSSEREQQRLAVDLKTMLNFKLSVLRDRGISQPLAALILSGEHVDAEFRRVAQGYFPMGVRPPQVHPGFLDESLKGASVSTELFLVALGLTVN